MLKHPEARNCGLLLLLLGKRQGEGAVTRPGKSCVWSRDFLMRVRFFNKEKWQGGRWGNK